MPDHGGSRRFYGSGSPRPRPTAPGPAPGAVRPAWGWGGIAGGGYSGQAPFAAPAGEHTGPSAPAYPTLALPSGHTQSCEGRGSPQQGPIGQLTGGPSKVKYQQQL